MRRSKEKLSGAALPSPLERPQVLPEAISRSVAFWSCKQNGAGGDQDELEHFRLLVSFK